jgi:hypothetical protein
MSQPIVSFDGLTYTVSLFRPDGTGSMKEQKIIFGEHRLEVCAAPPHEMHLWERAQINGPPAEDGLLYYLCAQPQDVGRPSFYWLNGKEESLAIRKAIREAEDEAYNYDSKCTFCGSMESDCGGDHGDEMRDEMREAEW